MMGSLSYINQSKNSLDFNKRWPAAKRLSDLSADICTMQLEGGRYFLAEHPERSRQWALPKWKTLLSKKEILKVKGDQCEFGLVCPEGHPVQKRTCFVANSLLLVRPLGRFCKGRHKLKHRVIEGSVKGHLMSKWCQRSVSYTHLTLPTN